MKLFKIKKNILIVLAANLICSPLFAENKPVDNSMAMITSHIFEQVKKNENWKLAFNTGKDAQVVFMNITPQTNPKNEIGMETHTFDQVIFVVEGEAKTVLSGKVSTVKSGDMIFVPQGVPHNVINLDAKKPLKILSVYSSTDIPANAVYKQKPSVVAN